LALERSVARFSTELVTSKQAECTKRVLKLNHELTLKQKSEQLVVGCARCCCSHGCVKRLIS